MARKVLKGSFATIAFVVSIAIAIIAFPLAVLFVAAGNER